ncbi:MAG: hypothetical protein K2Q10_13660 [Rhodospirillales bacterium]|nr:hypothetical protein [Rhodospirillales bacterium]
MTARPLGLVWVFCLVALGPLPFLDRVLNDPDTYWHVASGLLILDGGGIPDRDVFSHTVAGRSWVLHEWLAQAVMAACYRAGGWPAVALLAPLAAAAAMVLLVRHLGRSLDWPQMVISVLLALLLLLPHLLARPHVLAWPLMVWWTSELLRAAEGRATPPWGLLPVMTLWANLHGSFLLGLGLGGFIAAESAFEHWRREGRLAPPWLWAAFLALAVAAACLTPDGPARFRYVLEVMGQSVQLGTIAEWKSPDFQKFEPLQVWLFAALGVALLTGLRLPWTRIVVLLGLLHLALRHVRYGELVGLLAPLFLAGPLAANLRPGAKAPLSRPALLLRLSRPLPVVVCLAVMALAMHAAIRSNIQPAPRHSPVAALAAVQAAGIGGPVLNEYGFGGYLIHAGVPTFIDGRSDLYGDSFLAEYAAATDLTRRGALPALLNRYGIAWTLLPAALPAASLLDHLPGWRRLYADERAVVHVRDDPP